MDTASWPDPRQARTPAQYVQALRRLKGLAGLGYRALEQRAARAGASLPRSTLMSALSRKSLPREDLVAAFVRACGGGPEEVERWVEVRRLLEGDLTAGEPDRGGDRSPYLGLAPFGPEDAPYFLGRERLTAELVDRVVENSGPLIVMGPSGVGKSSLLHAGLIPALTRSGEVSVVAVTPGRDPLGGLTPSDARTVLIVDQLEELFLNVPPEEQRAFVRLIAEWPAPVVMGMRADFSAHAMSHPELVSALAHPVPVGPLTRTELRTAIEGPARIAGLTFQDGLVDLLMEEHEGALPLLSHALRGIWEQRDGSTLTLAGYRATGGIRGALARTADATLDSLGLSGRQAARSLFLRLVRLGDGTEDTRRVVALADLRAEEDPGMLRVLDLFVAARLLTVDQDTVRLAHEALIRSWPRLRSWIDADRMTALVRQQVGEAAAEWERHDRDPAFLYSGTRLATARTARGLPPGVTDFLRAGERAEALVGRRRRLTVATLAVLLVTALVGAGTVARMAGAAAEERDRSISRQLASDSLKLAASDPFISRGLSVAAWDFAHTPEAEQSMLAAHRNPARAILRGHGEETVWGLSSDGARLAASAGSAVKLWGLPGGEAVATLEGHTDEVGELAFSPDATLLASGSVDGTARLWGAADGRVVAVLQASTDDPMIDAEPAVISVKFTPDGTQLVTGSLDGTVRLWEVPSGRLVVTMRQPYFGVMAMSPDGTRLLTESGDTEDGGQGEPARRLWDLADGRLLMTRKTAGLDEYFTSPGGRWLAVPGLLLDTRTGEQRAELPTGNDVLAFSPDGSRMATVEEERVEVWDVTKDRPAVVGAVGLPDPGRKVTGLTLSPDGERVAIAAGEGGWVADQRGWIQRIEAWNVAAFSADGRFLATAGADGVVRLWDASTGQLIDRLRGHNGRVEGVVFALGDSALVTFGAADGTVRLWDVPAAAASTTYEVREAANFMVVSGDLSRAMSVDRSGFIRVWETRYGRLTTKNIPGLGGADGGALSPDGSVLAVSSGKFYNFATDQMTHVSSGSPVFAPTGRRLLVTAPEQARLWDPVAGTLVHELTGSADNAAFSPDGSTMATYGADGAIRLWDGVSGSSRATLRPPAARPVEGDSEVLFSPDGSLLAVAEPGGSIFVWEVATGRRISTVAFPSESEVALAFHPDGSLLAAVFSRGGEAGGLRVWDTRSGRLLNAFDDPSEGIDRVAFHPSGKLLATADQRGTIRLWSPHQGEQLGALTGHVRSIQTMAFSSDGHRLTTNDGHTVKVWEVSMPSDLAGELCSRPGGRLAPADWAHYIPDVPYRSRSCRAPPVVGLARRGEVVAREDHRRQAAASHAGFSRSVAAILGRSSLPFSFSGSSLKWTKLAGIMWAGR